MNRKEARTTHQRAAICGSASSTTWRCSLGMRPGEILALQRRHIAEDCSELVIEQRLYRGDIDDPKTTSSKRTVGIPSQDGQRAEGMDGAGRQEAGGVGFRIGEPGKADVAGQRLVPAHEAQAGNGRAWAGRIFRCCGGRMPASATRPKVDPKVAADQRGHGIGVALDVYTSPALKHGGGRRRCWRSGSVAGKPETAKAERQKKSAPPRLNGVVLEWKKLLIIPKLLKRWSGRRGSNPRRPAWEAGILPLNYSRFLSNQLFS